MSWKPRVQKDNKWTEQQSHNEPNEVHNYGKNHNSNYQDYKQRRKPYHRQYNETTYYQKNHSNRYNHYHRNHNNRYYNEYDDEPNHNRYYQASNNNQRMNKSRNNIKFVKNTGKWNIDNIPSHELKPTLQWIWDKYYHKNVEMIQKIIFLCGPPGSGKTSISNFVENYHNLNALNTNDYMIDVSSIISNVIKTNNGRIITYKVYQQLLKQILQNVNKHKVLIIDGFLRFEQHVDVVNFLMLLMKQTVFIFLVIDVDEETAVKRQIERGQRLLKLLNSDTEQKQQNQKQQRLKDSDLYPQKARQRYQKYNRLLGAVQYKLKTETKSIFDIIDGTKSLQNVYHNVQIQLKKQDNATRV